MHVWQGSQRPGKSWKTWKMKKAFSRPGKIMEFEKKAKIMEKSWNFKIPLGKNCTACILCKTITLCGLHIGRAETMYPQGCPSGNNYACFAMIMEKYQKSHGKS